MKVKAGFSLAVISLIFAWQSVIGGGLSSSSGQISGIYVMAGNTATMMKVNAEGDQYWLELSGGSEESAGAAASADCFIRAQGKLDKNRLTAAFTAIETDTFSYSEAQARREDRKLEVVFGMSKATVVYADTVGYCGLTATFQGEYQREAVK